MAKQSASLALLKGGAKEAVSDELDKSAAPEAAAEAEATEEEVEVDIDPMNAEQITALVTENQIETPAGWAKMSLAKKKSWLKEQFEAPAEGEEATAEEEVKEAAVEEAAAALAEKPGEETNVEEKSETVAEAEAAKPAKKGKTKSKSVATTDKALEGEIVGSDTITDLVHTIENMGETEARDLVGTLAEETEATFFKLGGVLSVIQANGWFTPYASFREFVEKEHGLHYRKAVYWVGIYNSLAESKVPWGKVAGLGWTKLKEIAAVLTPDNVDEWVKIAGGQTTLQLIETVKASLQKDAPKQLADQTSKTVTTKTFKVHDEQKATIDAALAKAKDEGGTQVDTVALEYICSDYLGSATLGSKLKAMGIEKAVELLEKAFPEATINVEV